MLFGKDREHRHVRCYVHGRIEVTTNGTTSSAGQLFGIIRQPNCLQCLEDIHEGGDLVGSSKWRESSVDS